MTFPTTSLRSSLNRFSDPLTAYKRNVHYDGDFLGSWHQDTSVVSGTTPHCLIPSTLCKHPTARSGSLACARKRGCMWESRGNNPRACPVCGNTNLHASQRQHIVRNNSSKTISGVLGYKCENGHVFMADNSSDAPDSSDLGELRRSSAGVRGVPTTAREPQTRCIQLGC